MSLYTRLCGIDPDAPRLSIHVFEACMGEIARGQMTGAEAQVKLAEGHAEKALTAGEVTEATTLFNTITGSATAKLLRATEIMHVLILGSVRVGKYASEADIKTRLGV